MSDPGLPLGDLTLSALRPVLEPDGPAGGPLAARCFGSQRPVTDIGAGMPAALLTTTAVTAMRNARRPGGPAPTWSSRPSWPPTRSTPGTERFHLAPGDRLLVVSDGVHAAAPQGRAPFGESGLPTALRRTRLQPATEAVATVMRGHREYHAGDDPADDAVTVCLDWRR